MTRRGAAGLAAVWLLAASQAPAQEADAGARAFEKCISCHSMDRSERDLSGPNLAGVVGRRAASLPGFAFSPAMRRAGADGLVWTEAALERYLKDPLGEIPGTTMSFAGVRNRDELQTLIAYLRRFP